MWVYRIELPPRAERSVRAAVPRYVDVYFDPSYKLYQTHAQRISTEPRVPMFEGFTMPPLTLDAERNALYKQVQCRPTAVDPGDSWDHAAETLVLDAFKTYSTPKKRIRGEDLSETAAVAFTRSFLEWQEMKKEAAIARHRFAARLEFPSLWETSEMVSVLEEKLSLATGTTVTTPAEDPDRLKPRCTAAQYSSLLAESRIAHLEGLARARQQKPNDDGMRMPDSWRNTSKSLLLEKRMMMRRWKIQRKRSKFLHRPSRQKCFNRLSLGQMLKSRRSCCSSSVRVGTISTRKIFWRKPGSKMTLSKQLRDGRTQTNTNCMMFFKR